VVRQHRLRAAQAYQLAPGNDEAEQIFALGVAEPQQDVVVRQRRSCARHFTAGRRLQPGEVIPCEHPRRWRCLRHRPAHVVPALPQRARQGQKSADVAEVGAEFPSVEEFAHVVLRICLDSTSRNTLHPLFARRDGLR